MKSYSTLTLHSLIGERERRDDESYSGQDLVFYLLDKPLFLNNSITLKQPLFYHWREREGMMRAIPSLKFHET